MSHLKEPVSYRGSRYEQIKGEGMIKNMKFLIAYGIMTGLFCAAGQSPAFAEEAGARQGIYEQYQRLMGLRESNPEAYQKVVAQKKQFVKQQFQNLRREQPEMPQRFSQFDQKERPKRLERLAQRSPGEFHQFMQQRVSRYDQVRREQPERWQQFENQHPNLQQRVRQFLNRPSPAQGQEGPGGMAPRREQDVFVPRGGAQMRSFEDSAFGPGGPRGPGPRRPGMRPPPKRAGDRVGEDKGRYGQ